MSGWCSIIIEGYCTYSWASKKKWKMYSYTKGIMKGKPKAEIRKNEHYIPPTKRPNWCKKQNKKMLPQFRCMAGMIKQKHCPFFAYCNAEEKKYLWDNLFYTNVPKEVRKLIKKGVIKVIKNE